MNHPRACSVNKTFLATRPFTEKERDNRRGKKTLVRVATSVSSRPRPALTSPRHGPLKFQRHTHIRTRICTRYYVRIHSQRADTRAYPTSIRPIFVSRPWIIENDVARERERGEGNTTGTLCPVSTGPWPYFKVPLGVASSCTP